MAFLFNRSNRPKAPQDLVRSVRESISRLDVPSEKKRAIEEITKCLNAMKNILIGDGGTIAPNFYLLQNVNYPFRSRSNSRTSSLVITRDIYIRSSSNPLLEFISIWVWGEEGFHIDFQYSIAETSRGDAVPYRWIFSAKGRDITCSHKGVSLRCSQISHINARSYENHEVALNCGTVLREAFKHEQLAKIVLYSPVFWSFFDYVETGVFDVAGDAFSTFKVEFFR